MKVGLALLAFIMWFTVFGQVVTFKWAHNPCEVGRLNQLNILIRKVSKDSVKHQPFAASMSCKLLPLDSNRTGKIEQIVVFKEQKRKDEWDATYSFIPWDTGAYTFPLFVAQIGDTFVKAQLPILQVKYRNEKLNTDISEWFAQLPFHLSPYVWISILVLILAAVVFWLYRNKKKQDALVVAETVLEKTINELLLLKKERLWEKGQVEQHFIRFSSALKQYLSLYYGIPLTERTTQECILLLQSKGVDRVELGWIKGLLDLSDYAKFAAAQPSSDEVEGSLDWTIELIQKQANESNKSNG